ncbi:unnamed protein product [Arabis nemorensis]|uniref:Uncharacterized protein n=1 Tax=Arabis nemorensis TaxID=586526 RepID=A0A565AX24_9BRAS|nr:unnamed protein product [Arabis nemorensis]
MKKKLEAVDVVGEERFEILAFSCNQFGNQEPDSNEEIVAFACTRFKAEYPIFDKVLKEESNASRIPQLVPDQIFKLKKLTVLTLAESNKVLPYDTLMVELDVTNFRELEDFLINECMYTDCNIRLKFYETK